MRQCVVFGLLALLGCGDNQLAVEEFTVTTANSRVWSGSTLRLESPAFQAADSLPIVTTGSETLTVRSGGPLVALVQLPDTNGPLSLSVAISHGRRSGLGITTYGFAASRSGPPVDGAPQVWPGGGAPTALAISNGRLVLIDYRLETAQPLSSDSGLGSPWLDGPGLSATDSGLVVIARWPGPMIAVPVRPGAPPPDTGPTPSEFYPAVHLATGTWLQSRKHWLEVRVRQPDGSFVSSAAASCEEPTRFAISPGASLVVPIGCSPNAARMPIYNAATRSLAYRLSFLSGIGGAGFSRTGDTLFLTGTDSLNGNSWLYAIEPTAGVPLARVALDDWWYADVLVDPTLPRLYVADIDAACNAAVAVFDRRTLQQLATLRAPASAVPHDWGCDYSWHYILAIDSERHHLYLTVNHRSGAVALTPLPASYVLVFDLLP